MGTYGTPFLESEILLAVTAGNDDEALEMIRTKMSAQERATFEEQLDHASELVYRVRSDLGENPW
jgi:hypothetical protein